MASTKGAQDVNILAIDVGTTTMVCHLYDENAIVKSETVKMIQLLYPRRGWVEIDPDQLWQQFVDCIKETLKNADVRPEQVTAMGISTQRSTFITWDKNTGKPFHNFITWQDLRASNSAEKFNSSFKIKSVQAGSKLLHMVSGRKQFLAASVIRFSSQHASTRLHWVLSNYPEILKKAQQRHAKFGTLDTWLIWKLTKGKKHITDYSNASSTGIYDSFVLQWSSFILNVFGIPATLLPEVVDTSGHICDTDESIFGASIPVKALVADQQSSVFAQCCFDVGDIKLTLGTGMFIDINTGKYPHASCAGLYPLVGWKNGKDLVYIAEGNATGVGTSLEWAKKMGFYEKVSETSSLAYSLPDSGGVYFVPAFNGLQAPVNDNTACVSLMGLKASSTKAHIIRSILESIAYRFYQLYDTAEEETQTPLMSSIKADGGVCNNNFVMDLISSLTGQSIDRPTHTDTAALGAAFLAGMASGVWKSYDEIKAIRCSEKLFQPDHSIKNKYNEEFLKWQDAVERSRNWYQKEENTDLAKNNNECVGKYGS